MLLSVLFAISLSGCVTGNGFKQAEKDKAEAQAASKIIADVCIGDRHPDEFRRHERANISNPELDDAAVVAIKYDRALGRSNNRIDRIASHYDRHFDKCNSLDPEKESTPQ